MRATGGVHAQYQGYDLFADEVSGNLDTNQFELIGNVKLVGQDEVVQGERVFVDFRQRTFRATHSDVQLSPGFTQGRTVDEVYIRGENTYGSRRELFGDHSATTTCNLDHPHYELLSDSTVVRPGRRAILRDVRVQLFGRTVLGLPYLSIPLDDRNEKYIPKVGQTPDEGYYVKFKYPVPLRGNNNFLDANLDYYSKIGSGFGGTYRYEGSGISGQLRAYGIVGQTNTFEADAQHSQKIGALDASFSGNLQRNNYLNAPANTFYNFRGLLRMPSRGGSTSLSYNRSSNEASGFRFLQQTWSFSDQRQPFARTTTTLELSLASNETSFGGSTTMREQADVRFRGQHDLVRALAELEYQRAIPIGSTTSFFSSSDRTPVFTLRTDARRLFGSQARSAMPFQANLSFGEFANPGNGDRIGRAQLDMALAKPDDGRGVFGVGFDTRLRQGVYSDDTAQYVLNAGVSTRYSFSRDTGLNLRYYFLEPNGFTPLFLDRSGRSNLATADLSFNVVRGLRLGAQSGYDFLLAEQGSSAWQPAGVRAEWRPAEWFSLRGLATYDPFQHSWSNVRLDLGYMPGATYVSAGARYDGTRHTWGDLNLYVDGFKWGRLKTSMILAYNGYLKRFDARHFSFTYDLHCAEAILQILDNPTGFRPGTQVAFYFRLKAFPFNTGFGTGRFGEAIGTGTGRDGF